MGPGNLRGHRAAARGRVINSLLHPGAAGDAHRPVDRPAVRVGRTRPDVRLYLLT